MPGEQLPPVVARFEGDDSEFLDMLDRDVAALRAAAGEIDGLLAGLDLGAALADSLGTANLASLNTDQIAQGLSEALGGVGAALGQDVGSQLGDAVRAEGIAAGAALAEGVAEGASGAGDAIGQDLTDGLTAEASTAGTRAGEALSESLTGAVSGVGQDVASQVDSELGALPGRFAAIGTTAGHAMTTSLEGALLGLAGAAVGVAGTLTGIGAAIEARLADLLLQAGQSAGPSLLAGISASAAGSAGAVASAVGTAIEASLGDALTQAGGPGGDALLAGIAQGASQGADETASKISEALQAPLEAQMTTVGQVAGDAFNAGLGSATGAEGGSAGAGGAIVQEFEQSENEVEQKAEQLGRTAKLSFAQGWQTRNGVVPFGGQMEPDELLGMNKQPDPFVPNIAAGENAWTLASKVGAQDAAKAAWQAYGDELGALVIPPERFLALTDTGVQLWREEVAQQAQASGEGFVSAFADAITMGMAGIDWGALTDAQAAALGEAMRGTITQGVAEAEPAAAAAAASVGEAMVAPVAEAMGELPAVAAERGAEAGSVFARAFSGAKGALAESFAAEFDDPQWAATMDKARVLAEDVKASVAAVGQDIRAEFADDPQWQARMAEIRALSETIVGGVKDAYGAVSDLGGAAVGRVRDAVGAIGDLGSAMAAQGREALGAIGDLPAAMVARARTAFDALSAYAEVYGDTIGGRFAGALTDSMTAFTGSVSAIGESVRLLFAGAPEGAAAAGAETAAAFDTALAEGLSQAAPEAAAAGDELVAVFDSIYRQSSLMSDNLVTAMTNALAEIEADTSSFTARELALWDEFTTVLEEKGTQAAYAAATAMNSMQGKDALALGVGSTGRDLGAAEGVASELGNMEKAASGASTGIGLLGMGMGGMGMQALWLGSMAIPYLSGALSGLVSAFEPTKAALLDLTQLESAIGSDGGVAGSATAAFVAQSSAANGLAQQAQQAGVSLTTWTEAVMGNKAAQEEVTAAVQNLNQKQLDQQVATDESAKSTGKFSDEQRNARTSVTENADATNELTNANQKLLDSMNAEAAQIASTIASQTQLTQAEMQLNMQSQIFSATLDGLYTKMLAQQQSAAESSVAILNLGSSQETLNMRLYQTVDAYDVAQQQGTAYGAVLTALNGTTNTLLGSEAAFTTSLGGLTTAVKTNGDSLDIANTKGAANVTVVTQIATAAQAAAVAVYQSEVQTQGATKAYEDANQKLEQEKEAFITAAEKAGLNKDAVHQLADQLYQLPADITTKITVDDSQAEAAINHVLDLYTLLNAQGANAIQEEVSAIKLQAQGARASGGPVEAGGVYRVGEQGEEWFVPQQDGYIVPHDVVAGASGPSMAASPSWMGASGGLSAAPQVNVHVYIDGREITAEIRADAQQYATYNGFTGFELMRG